MKPTNPPPEDDGKHIWDEARDDDYAVCVLCGASMPMGPSRRKLRDCVSGIKRYWALEIHRANLHHLETIKQMEEARDVQLVMEGEYPGSSIPKHIVDQAMAQIKKVPE